MGDLAARVRSAAAALTPDELAGPVLVGVSGGADSLALLHLLWRWSHEGGPLLHAAHVDHGLRPESRAEAERVRALCGEWGVPVSVARVDVAAVRAARRGGLEDAARVARYRALEGIAAAVGARVLALGHQADDRAETVLLHLLRGAGPAGLGALAVVRRGGTFGEAPAGPGLAEGADRSARGPLALWRPLLEVRRAALADYCRAWRLAPLHDPSNDDLRLRRNAVRHAILPALERHFPAAVPVLARDAALLADEDALLEELLDRRWPAVARLEEGLVVLDRAAFRGEHRAMQRRIVRRAWATLRGSTAGLTAAPVEAAREAIVAGRTGSRRPLPRDIVVVLDRDAAALGAAADIEDRLRRRLRLPLLAEGREEGVAAPGTIALGDGWAVEVCAAPAGGRWSLHIPEACGGAPGGWLLRTWHPGDWLPLPGGRGRQKLQDWVVDHHVPRYARRHLVLLARGARVVWIAGLASFTEVEREAGAGAGLWLRVLHQDAPLTERAAGVVQGVGKERAGADAGVSQAGAGDRAGLDRGGADPGARA